MNSTTGVKKTIFVTGASSGIGRAIALALAKDGFQIVTHYNSNVKGAQETLALIQNEGGTGILWQMDLSKPDTIEAKFDQFVEANPDILFYGLVNNAGIHKDSMMGVMQNSAFEEVITTNLYGPFVLTRLLVRRLLRLRQGVIVNIASIAGQTGNAGQVNYAASKAGLIAMTKSLAMEIGARNIRVNAVAPGLIETDMIKDIPGLEMIKSRIPLGRFGSPMEVAHAVSFLCSEKASYITGHTLSVNGGLFPS